MQFNWKRCVTISLLSCALIAVPAGIAYSIKEITDIKKERRKELETILLEAKAELKSNSEINLRYNLEELFDKINTTNFPFDSVDEFLENIGIPAYSSKIPKIVFERFEDSDVSGRYKDGIIFANPEVVLSNIKEGIIHEYVHSKGKFENNIINEGFVQYLTMTYLGTSIRSYSAEVYLINNLAYVLGNLKNPKSSSKKDSALVKEGIKIIAKAFSNNSLKEIEEVLSLNNNSKKLIESSFKKDELDMLRFFFNMEGFLKNKGLQLKDIKQFDIDASVFDYFDIDLFDENIKVNRKKMIQEKRIKTINELELLVAKNPEFESSLHFRIALGNLYLKEHDYEKTVKYLEEVIENKHNVKTNYSNDVLRLNLGFAYQKIKQPQKAIENYKKIVLKSKHSFMIVKANYLIAQTFLENNNTDEAIKTYKAIKNFKPFNEEKFVTDYIIKAYYDLGDIYFRKKDFESALKEFSTLIDLYPNSIEASDAIFKKAEIYEELEDVDNAMTNYEILINGRPKLHISSLARLRVAEILIENNEHDKAVSYLTDVFNYHQNTQESAEALRLLELINLPP